MTDHQLAREDGHESVVDVLNLFNLRPAWQTRALCHGQTKAFFALHYGRKLEREAHRAELRRRFCNHCPVRSECAEAGRDERYGVWGAA